MEFRPIMSVEKIQNATAEEINEEFYKVRNDAIQVIDDSNDEDLRNMIYRIENIRDDFDEFKNHACSEAGISYATGAMYAFDIALKILKNEV